MLDGAGSHGQSLPGTHSQDNDQVRDLRASIRKVVLRGLFHGLAAVPVVALVTLRVAVRHVMVLGSRRWPWRLRAGPTSRSVLMPSSAASRPWSTALSPSAGTPRPSQPDPDPNPEPVPNADPTGRPERGPRLPQQPLLPYWPRALLAVRSWLTPSTALRRCWRAWSDTPPLPELQALLDAVSRGHHLNPYSLVQQTTARGGWEKLGLWPLPCPRLPPLPPE